MDKVGMRLALGIPVLAFPCGGLELASGCVLLGLTDVELAWCLGDASAATPPVCLGECLAVWETGVELLGVRLFLLELGVELLPWDLLTGVTLLLGLPERGVALRV